MRVSNREAAFAMSVIRPVLALSLRHMAPLLTTLALKPEAQVKS